MTVLLTSIGRRVVLARAFRKELAAYAPGSRLLGKPLRAGQKDASTLHAPLRRRWRSD